MKSIAKKKSVVGFNQLKVHCIIGVEPEERVKEQPLIVDLRLQLKLSSCFSSDNLKDTIDYVELADLCEKIAKEGKFQLIETYAHQVAERINNHYSHDSLWIRVEKPKALPLASSSFFELEIS